VGLAFAREGESGRRRGEMGEKGRGRPRERERPPPRPTTARSSALAQPLLLPSSAHPAASPPPSARGERPPARPSQPDEIPRSPCHPSPCAAGAPIPHRPPLFPSPRQVQPLRPPPSPAAPTCRIHRCTCAKSTLRAPPGCSSPYPCAAGPTMGSESGPRTPRARSAERASASAGPDSAAPIARKECVERWALRAARSWKPGRRGPAQGGGSGVCGVRAARAILVLVSPRPPLLNCVRACACVCVYEL
jgi:hypothetical protein